MELDDIKKLVALMEDRGVVELEMEDGKGKIRLVRDNHRAAASAAAPHPPPVPVMVPPPPALQSVHKVETPTVASALVIPSPMVGTFYRAPNPEAPLYVEVGSTVEIGDVVCIVEAMKMMNEIQAQIAGRVVSILVENGQPVEYGQALFALEPLQDS
jgi:acetyl-CoA carboxylase biotin carboxyl carrier protein